MATLIDFDDSDLVFFLWIGYLCLAFHFMLIYTPTLSLSYHHYVLTFRGSNWTNIFITAYRALGRSRNTWAIDRNNWISLCWLFRSDLKFMIYLAFHAVYLVENHRIWVYTKYLVLQAVQQCRSKEVYSTGTPSTVQCPCRKYSTYCNVNQHLIWITPIKVLDNKPLQLSRLVSRVPANQNGDSN